MNIGLGLLSRTVNKWRFVNQTLCRSLSYSFVPRPHLLKGVTCSPLSYLQAQLQSNLNNKMGFSFRTFSNFTNIYSNGISSKPKPLSPITPDVVQTRSHTHSHVVIKYSMNKGKRVTNKDVLKRFKRLNWGIWIRPKSGAHRMLWKKKAKRVHRLRQNVFCNATHSRKLDKLVTRYWRKPRVYADDPYEPYLNRENCRFTQTIPKDY